MCNKRRFDRIGADLALIDIRRRRRRQKQRRGETRRYWCETCRAYHLTSQRQEKAGAPKGYAGNEARQ